ANRSTRLRAILAIRPARRPASSQKIVERWPPPICFGKQSSRELTGLAAGCPQTAGAGHLIARVRAEEQQRQIVFAEHDGVRAGTTRFDLRLSLAETDSIALDNPAPPTA